MAVHREGAATLLPGAVGRLEETFASGETYLNDNLIDKAEEMFRFAWMQGKLLENDLTAERKRLQDEQAQRMAVQRKETEKQTPAAGNVPVKGLDEGGGQRAAEELLARKMREEAAAVLQARKKQDRMKPQRERPLPGYHTVKRGETLPQIASQADVYNDTTLWPLLYRANRDQIRDPKHLWPGQVLRIPRNVSREDSQEARRYYQERHLY
jgi:nucleoid-associated protein YgaU